MTKRTLLIGIAYALSLFTVASVQAAKPDDATMELQYRFPICSEVLKAKRDTAEQTDAEKDLLEGPELLPLLNQYKRQRADLNAYFRQGTPLHHAACAGWNTEVLWLLRNGADPFLEASGYDALAIAVRTENWAVANTVLKHYQRLLGTASVSEKQQALIHASVESAAPQAADAGDKVMQYQDLLKKLGWKPSPKAWGKRYGELLCGGKAEAALEIVKRQPWGKTAPAEIADASWTCPIYFNGQRSAEVLPQVADMRHWKALDALLPNPVLLPLVPVLPSGKGETALRATIGHGLRAPCSSQELATIYFRAVLSRRAAPEGEEPALLRLIPQNVLPKVLEASETQPRFHFSPYQHPLGGTALLRAGAWPLADLEWLIAQLSPSLITRVQDQLHQWPDRASAAHWEKLTPHLVAPLSIPHGYPKSLPYAMWPKWMALGARPADERSAVPGEFTYTWSRLLASIPISELTQGLAATRQLKGAAPQDWPTEADWARLLLRATPQELPEFLALAKAHRADLLPRFMDWALAPLSFGPTPDAVASALSPPSVNRFGPDSGGWERVRALAALGFKARHPRYPIQNLSEADRPDPPLQEAIQNGWLIAPPQKTVDTDTANPGHVQWIKPLLTCHKQVDSGLRRALATSGQGADPDEGDSAYLVPVQVSGLDNCQWLKVGGRFPGRYSWIDHDFFEGETERRANAADGNRSAMFWHSVQQTFLDSGVEPNAGEAILMHQSGHVAPWVAISGSVDWGQFSNDIFQARLQHNNTVVLEPLPTDHPGRISLIAQCGSELQLEECEALKEAVQNDELRGIAQFADTYWPQVREDFEDALLRNDRASLARMREEGLFSHWLSSGLRALGETSALSVMEKRRHAAWVLALDRPHAAYDAATLDSLLLWLPPEDWHPIVKRLRCYQREQLLEKVKQTKDHILSSRLRYEMNRFDCEAL